MADYVARLAHELIGQPIRVRIADDPGWRFDACYGRQELILNRAALGTAWFAGQEAGHGIAAVKKSWVFSGV